MTMHMIFRSLVLPLAALVLAASAAEAQTFNAKVVSFLAGKVGKRVGGGECAHAAQEALRVSGAEFDRTDLGRDSPAPGDYVWGTLVKSITSTNGKVVDSAPSVKLLAGDVIQYRNARFVAGTASSFAAQHTSVVAAVSATGMPTFVYQQNVSNQRIVRRDAIDLTKLTGGYLRIYRPKARRVTAGKYKFTIVNNMPSAQTVKFRNNTTAFTGVSLTATNTGASYLTSWMTITGTGAKPNLWIQATGSTVPVVSGAAYEVYSVGGKATLRRLAP
jgi:hypothetical protein